MTRRPTTSPRASDDDSPSPPAIALILGWAGVLPFWALALALTLGLEVPGIANVPAALVAYAAIILSFMAGVHWGLAMRAPDAPDGPAATRLMMLSVVPAIIAWFAVLAAAQTALLILALLFTALLPVDLWAISHRLAPPWYRPLRLQLTAAVLAALALAVAQ